jgi:hypothetical protein
MYIDIQNSDLFTNTKNNELFVKHAILSRDLPLTGIILKAVKSEFNFRLPIIIQHAFERFFYFQEHTFSLRCL